MFRINDMIDLPVVDCVSKRRICTIRDVIVDMRAGRVYALVCKERLFSRAIEAIPFTNVADISQNGVKAGGSNLHMSLRELRMKHRRLQSYQDILGKLVLGGRGEPLGIIRDILIDVNSGAIKAYELSEGYIDDLLKGRQIIAVDGDRTFDDGNMVMKDVSAQHAYQFNNQ